MDVDIDNLPEDLTEEEIQKLLDAADNTKVQVWSEESVESVTEDIKEKISANRSARLDSLPNEQVLATELALYDAITNFSQLAAYPNLYKAFAKTDVFFSLGEVLDHVNEDLIVLTLRVISDIIDIEIVKEADAVEEFIAVINSELNLPQYLGLLWERVLMSMKQSEFSDESYEYANAYFTVFEKVLEYNEQELLTEILSDNSPIHGILSFPSLLPTINEISCYSVEVVQMLFDLDPETFGRSIDKKKVTHELLLSLHLFKKKAPDSIIQSEFAKHLINLIKSFIQLFEDMQKHFVEMEGVQLAVRIMLENTIDASLMTGLLGESLQGNKLACANLIDCNGLGALFGHLMKVGQSHYSKKKTLLCNILICLKALLRNSTGEGRMRLLSKFLESKGEKIEKMFEIFTIFLENFIKNHPEFFNITDIVARGESANETEVILGRYNISANDRKKVKAKDEEIDVIEKEMGVTEKEKVYLAYCDSGYDVLLVILQVMALLNNSGNALISKRLYLSMDRKGIEIERVLSLIQYYLDNLISDIEGEATVEETEEMDLWKNLFKKLLQERESFDVTYNIEILGV